MNIPITHSDHIKKLLPHREPMIMVDALLEFSQGKATIGFTIRENNIFVQDGGFSETGLIEHMAQAAALYTGYKHYSNDRPIKEGFIASIKKLQIQQLPKVNQIIKTEVEIVHEIMQMTTVRLRTFLGELEIATSEMNTVLKPEEE